MYSVVTWRAIARRLCSGRVDLKTLNRGTKAEIVSRSRAERSGATTLSEMDTWHTVPLLERLNALCRTPAGYAPTHALYSVAYGRRDGDRILSFASSHWNVISAIWY